MAEPFRLAGLDPMKTRWLLGALALVACGLLVMVPVAGIDPVTGSRVSGAQATERANAERAREALEAIAVAQSLLRKDTNDDGVVEYGTLEDLHAAGLIDADLADGRAHGYVFQVTPSPRRPEFEWLGLALPEPDGPEGPIFVVDQVGIVETLPTELASTLLRGDPAAATTATTSATTSAGR